MPLPQKPLLGLAFVLTIALPAVCFGADFDPSGGRPPQAAIVTSAQSTTDPRLEGGNLQPYRVVDSQSSLDFWVETLVTGHRLSDPDPALEIDGMKFTPSAPEPGIWAILLAGFAALGILTRRSRRDRQLMQLRDRCDQRLERLRS